VVLTGVDTYFLNVYNYMDASKHYLGKLCPYDHEFQSTGQSMRYTSVGSCVVCCKTRYRFTKKPCKKVEARCLNCKRLFKKPLYEFKRSVNHFCCQSCSASWNNVNKKYGIRRSKLERYIEDTLRENYPLLEIKFNHKDVIGSELDIYFPTLRLGIELNGIFHYEPIYGNDKLGKIQLNDRQKLIQCYNKGIELVIIDTTTKGKRKYYNIINKILKYRLSGPTRI
jgi:hypothetical protein